jgi:hypothetical protein
MAGRESTQGHASIDEYVGKWHAREPEMEIGELFVPVADRARFRAWGALQFELREAAFELSDPRVTATKAGWWIEELSGLAQGRARHPISRVLAPHAAKVPWTDLVRGLGAVIEDDARPSSTQAAFASVAPLARGVAAIEAGLFESASGEQVERSIAVHLLLHRLLVGLGGNDAGRIPLSLLARHGATAADLREEKGRRVRIDWAGELARTLPDALPNASLYRRLTRAFDHRRLARFSREGELTASTGLATAWDAWRAARRRA